MASNPVRVIVWDEAPGHANKTIYPNSLNSVIAAALNLDAEIVAVTANQDEPNQGITQEALDNADVLIWWGHARHNDVTDETAELVKNAVLKGMGFIALHSAHYSKTFKSILGCTGHLGGGWREGDPPDTEEITVCAPRHPIAEGVEDFVLDEEEMYGAPFDVPPFETLVFQSYFPVGGEYFPSFTTTVGEGITPNFLSGPGKGIGRGKGAGRVFYFRPGHEAFGTYHHPSIQRIIRNAVLWTAKRTGV